VVEGLGVGLEIFLGRRENKIMEFKREEEKGIYCYKKRAATIEQARQ
jgi:hypothetical protein